MIYTTKNIAQTFQQVSADTVSTPIINISNSTRLLATSNINTISSDLKSGTASLQLSNDGMTWMVQQILPVNGIGPIIFNDFLNTTMTLAQISYSSTEGLMTVKTTLTYWTKQTINSPE